MRHTLAAIRSGTDPVAALPAGTFHRTLEETLSCPKCEAIYILVADYDWSVSRHFAAESRRHLALLRKAVFLGHANGHRTTHLETNGISVTSHSRAEAQPSLETLPPATHLLQ